MGRLTAVLRFLGFYARTMVTANFDVTRRVLSPPADVIPAIIRVPVQTASRWRVVVFAHIVSLTPGTLTIAIAEDGSAIFVHTIEGSSPEQVRAQLTELESRLLEAIGW